MTFLSPNTTVPMAHGYALPVLVAIVVTALVAVFTGSVLYALVPGGVILLGALVSWSLRRPARP